jgi:CheY-like chemotaxis protein
LVIDDENAIAAMIDEMLSSLGYRVRIETSPTEALRHVCQTSKHYDLIISDIAMPGMTGIELVKHLSRIGTRIPVILCSAYTGGINWDTARSIGIRTMLTKPIRMRELATKVREVLDGGVERDPGKRGRGNDRFKKTEKSTLRPAKFTSLVGK